jgi:hypothetical protein
MPKASHSNSGWNRLKGWIASPADIPDMTIVAQVDRLSPMVTCSRLIYVPGTNPNWSNKSETVGMNNQREQINEGGYSEPLSGCPG